MYLLKSRGLKYLSTVKNTINLVIVAGPTINNYRHASLIENARIDVIQTCDGLILVIPQRRQRPGF